MEFGELVRRRRMVRKFEARPIPDDVLRRVLDVARHAPSGGFSQGFDFLVLQKRQELEWFFRTTTDPSDPDPYPGKQTGEAPAALVLPFSNKRLYLERYAQPDKIAFGMDKEENWPVPFWTVDTSMAIMLILLNAVNEGLGAWYFGITHGEGEVHRELGVPEGCEMLGVIALGYASADDRPSGSAVTRRRRPFEEMFHFGRW
jgi:nitroreductase